MFGWLFKSEPESYEAILKGLADDIADRRARLADIRQRQRRAAFWLTVYAGAAWVIYVALWYARLVPNVRSGRQGSLDKAIKAAPVVVGPVLIIFARRIMQAWYTRIGNAEEATLKRLTVKQRETIEDIKKKTNYYSTKNLLERYESPATPQKRPQQNPAGAGPNRPFPGQNGQNGQTVQQRPGAQRPGLVVPQVQAQGQGQGQGPAQGMNNHLLSPIQQPVSPARRQWYDRLADAVLGEDADGPDGKYALICGKCFAHNGLVKEEIWAQTKYTCPKCGFFNDAPASRRSASPGMTSSMSSPVGSTIGNGGSGAGPVGISASATMPSLRPNTRQSLAAQARAQAIHGRSPLSVSSELGSTDEQDADEEDEVEGDVSREETDS